MYQLGGHTPPGTSFGIVKDGTSSGEFLRVLKRGRSQDSCGARERQFKEQVASVYFTHIVIEGYMSVMQTSCEIIFQCLDIVNVKDIQAYKEFL